MMPEPQNEETCTCMCTPCAEFAGCAACPDCADGCDACGYPHPEVDLAAGAEEHDGEDDVIGIAADTARLRKMIVDAFAASTGAPESVMPRGSLTGFPAGPMIIDEAGPNHWTGAP